MANLDGVSFVLAGRKDFESSLSTNVQKVYTIPGPKNKNIWGRELRETENLYVIQSISTLPKLKQTELRPATDSKTKEKEFRLAPSC